MNHLSKILIHWYTKNKRELPWRKTNDPYKIWLSEIILQQTRIEQGTPYYYIFVKHFPTVHDLATAKTDTIMKLWQGLGYYSRAINLHKAAKEILKNYHGIFPSNYEDIIKIKGIGDYTACAILSIVFNKPYAVVDGNVIRVITRIFGIKENIKLSQTKKEIKKTVTQLLPPKQAGDFNQAMMEFGALQCKPKNPDCLKCIMNKFCIAYKENIISYLPNKTQKIKSKKRFFYYFFIKYKKGSTVYTYIRKRDNNDIWKQLYEFPCITTEKKLSKESIIKNKEWKEIFHEEFYKIQSIHISDVHELSHQTIYAEFYEVIINKPLVDIPYNLEKINIKNINHFAISRLIEKFLKKKNLL